MPFEDEVALVCNDDGKWKAMELNRAIYNEEGQMMDIIAGPFLYHKSVSNKCLATWKLALIFL